MSEMDKNKNSLLMVIITLLVITIILLVAVIGMMFARNNGDQPVSGNLPTSSQEESSSSEPEESDPEEEEESSSSSTVSSSRPVSGGSTTPVSRPTYPTPPSSAPSSSSQAPAQTVQNKLTYNSKGTYDDSQICKSLSIGASGVTVKNMTVKGDLTIQSGVGKSGTVKLENVIVEGKLYVYGGGEIELKDVVAPNMTVQRSSDGFHITATGNTKINNTVLKAHATLEEKRLADDAEGFMRVTLMESTQIWYEVSIKNAVLTEIAVYSPANINLSSNTKVGTVVAAANVHFTGKGQIGTLQVKADRVSYSVKPKKIQVKGDYEEPKLGGYPIGTPEPDEGGGGGSHKPSSSSSSSSSSTPTPVKTPVAMPSASVPEAKLKNDNSAEVESWAFSFSMSNTTGVTGYVVTPIVDGALLTDKAKTLGVGDRSAVFTSSEINPQNTIAYQVVAKGDSAQNRTDSAPGTSATYQVALRLSYDGGTQKITAHKGQLAGSGTLTVNQHRSDGSKTSYELAVLEDGSAVVASSDGVAKPLTPSAYVQLVYGSHQSPRYILPDWKVPQPAKVSAPIDVKLSAIPLDADGNIDTKKDAQLTITPPSDITGIASYQVTVVSGGSPLSPTYTIAAGSTTCNIPLSVLNGVDTFSISVLSRGDGNLNLDSDPISTQTWDLRLKFGYDSVAKCIKAVWSGMNTPAQLTVTEDKADAPGLYTFNSLSESFVELKWDNTALDLGGKTWRLTLTDAAGSHNSPWYTLPAEWVVDTASSTSPEEVPSSQGSSSSEE